MCLISLVYAEDVVEDTTSFESLESAVKALASEDYDERELASSYIWEHFQVSDLLSLEQTDDPEVKYRLKRLINYLKFSIRPDTSERVVEYVNEFFEASSNRKVRILDELISLNAYIQVFALVNSLDATNPDNERLRVRMKAVVKQALDYYVQEGKSDLAMEVLDKSELSSQNARLWATLNAKNGDEMPVAESEKGKLRKLAYLRRKGDREEAVAYAKEIDAESFLASQALLVGDFNSFFEWWKKHYENAGIDEDFLTALEARIKGDWETVEKFYAPLKRASEKSQASKQKAHLHLTALGQHEDAFSVLSHSEKTFFASYLTTRAKYEEFFELFDYPYGEKATEWVEENIEKEGEWWFDSSLQEYGMLGRQLLAMEDLDAVSAMLQPLWDEVKANEVDRLEFLIQLYSNGYIDNALALASEILDEANEREFRQLFIGNSEIANYLWRSSVKAVEELNFSKRVRVVLALTTGVVKGQSQLSAVDRTLEQIIKDCEENPNDETRELYLAQVYQALGKRELALKFHENRFNKKGEWQARYNLILKLFELDKLEEVKLLLEGLNNEGVENKRFFDFQKAMVLIRCGEVASAQSLFDNYLDAGLEDLDAFGQVVSSIESMQKVKEAEPYLERFYNVTDPDETNGFHWNKLLSAATIVAEENEDYRQAALFIEARILFYLRTYYFSKTLLSGGTSSSNLYIISDLRYKADLMWAKHYALNQKQMPIARKFLKGILSEWQASGRLADDLYPFLLEIDAKDLLSSSLDDSLVLYENALQLYPNCNDFKNTGAWLAARAQMRLDKASVWGEETLEQEPRNAAYLDTNAEVAFAQRNRNKALELSYRAWKDSDLRGADASMIRDQYYHFKDDELPKK